MTVAVVPSAMVSTVHGPLLTKMIRCESCSQRMIVPAQTTRAWCKLHSGTPDAEAIEAPTSILDQMQIERPTQPPPGYEPSPEPNLSELTVSERVQMARMDIEAQQTPGMTRVEYHELRKRAAPKYGFASADALARYLIAMSAFLRDSEHYKNLDKIIDTESLSDVRRAYTEMRRTEKRPKPGPPSAEEVQRRESEQQEPKRKSPSAAQVAKAMPQALATLEGVCLGLQGLPLDQLEPEDRERWSKAMRGVTRQLNAFVREMGKQEESENERVSSQD